MLDTVDAALGRMAHAAEKTLELEPNATSLDLFRAVYRNASLPLSTRMRAAAYAAPFEHPKLAVSVAIPPDGRWPERLEKALQSSEKVIEARKVDDTWEG